MSEGALPNEEQKRALCEMISCAFVEIRALARSSGATQIEDLADAFHNIPLEMTGWGLWSPDVTRGMLSSYQSKHHSEPYPGRRDYVHMFDETFGAA